MSKKKQADSITCRVLQPVLSKQHQRYFEPGEVITFDLSAEAADKPDIDALLAMGVLENYVELPEVGDGESGAISSESGA